jgi:hypothetical protein
MHTQWEDRLSTGHMAVTDEVIAYIEARKCDFRISTSCGGPILLPVAMKPPKKTDLQVKAGIHIHSPGTLHPGDPPGSDPALL